MKKTLVIFTLTTAFFSGVCHAERSQTDEQLINEMRATSSKLIKTLGKTLKSTIQQEGPEAAIRVCETVAPNLVNQISKDTGWKVSRVSLRVRNPLIGTPDAWERKHLLAFSKNQSNKNSSTDLTIIEVTKIKEGTSIRYLEALPTAPLCQTCHGKPEHIPNKVAKTLNTIYPFDDAKGYEVGEIRGAISIQAIIK